MSIVERALVKAQTSGATQNESARGPDATFRRPREVIGGRNLQAVLEKRAAQYPPVHVDLQRVTEGRFTMNETASDADVPSLLDDFRRLKRNVRDRAETSEDTPDAASTRLVMITSAVPGEGKTFTSANLAMSLASELDSWVLLVDSDVVRPKISRLLGLQDEPGLLDYLQEPGRDVASVLYTTDQPRLAVVPAGKTRENAHELFASQRLATFAAEVTSLYSSGIVIFDSPPALATTEPQILAGLVGQILFVVRSGHTEQRAVIEGVSSLGEGRPVGLVLNKYIRPAIAYGYGRYYKY